MRKTFQPLSPFTQPVSEALYQMQHWIERDKASRLLHAAPSRRDLKRRHWPEHVRISAAKPLGRRVTARGPRRKALAYWPDDGCQASLHPFLVCVMNGKAALRIADYNLHCQAGDWVFIPQGIARSTRSHLDPSQPDGQCNLLWFYLDETKNQFYAWIGHSEKSIHHSGPDYGTCWVESSQLARQFLSLCEEIQNGENPDVLYHLLSCVILLLRREIEQGHSFLPRHHQTGRHDNSSQSHPNPIERACIYIDEHLEHSLTADQIARYVCMSLTLFSRHFRRLQIETLDSSGKSIVNSPFISSGRRADIAPGKRTAFRSLLHLPPAVLGETTLRITLVIRMLTPGGDFNPNQKVYIDNIDLYQLPKSTFP